MEDRFVKLPFTFDVPRLLADLQTCIQQQWPDHYNQWDYDGKWTSISLRSASGNEKDIFPIPGFTDFKNTPLLDACPYFREVLAGFKCTQETARLLCLAPGSKILTHRDRMTDYANGVCRLHIPITTHPDVSFILDGVSLVMQPGECWYGNFNLPHSVANNSTVNRIHLVVDVLRNEWTDALFREAGFPVDAVCVPPVYNDATKAQIIASLLAMNTPTSLEMAKQMQQSTPLS